MKWRALLSKITIDSGGCWVWQGAQRAGYGTIRIQGHNISTHVLMYTFYVGPVPLGLELDHLCRNTLCCNPAHLEPVTHAENIGRWHVGRHTHCKRGHLLDDANVYRSGTRRCCRTCHHLRYLERRSYAAT